MHIWVLLQSQTPFKFPCLQILKKASTFLVGFNLFDAVTSVGISLAAASMANDARVFDLLAAGYEQVLKIILLSV
jgi:hypothetical protein